MTSTSSRRTQAQRREQSRQAVLDSAIRLFGEQGYDNTSLEQIAADCGLTIRPIYHYFGNKRALFEAVNEVMERRILDSMRYDDPTVGLEDNWQAYLDLCADPAFRRIVLIDSPNVLGRERWASSPVSVQARASLTADAGDEPAALFRQRFLSSVFMGAFTAAALTIGEEDDIEMARREAGPLMAGLFEALRNG